VIHKIGSIIVGPGAIAKVVRGNGQEVLTLPPNKVVANFLKLVPKEKVIYVHVVEA
jgi:ABC-type proline/glycine betaine transport system ATPase subunit